MLQRRWQCYRDEIRDVPVELADGHCYVKRTEREIRVGRPFAATDYIAARQIAHDKWPDWHLFGGLNIREAFLMPGVGDIL